MSSGVSADHSIFFCFTTEWPQNQIENWEGRNWNICLALLRHVLRFDLMMFFNNSGFKSADKCPKRYFFGNDITTFYQLWPITADWNKIKYISSIFFKLRTSIGYIFVLIWDYSISYLKYLNISSFSLTSWKTFIVNRQVKLVKYL